MADAPQAEPEHRRPSPARPALAGIIAAGAALGIGELFAGLISGDPSLLVAVGGLIIDSVPPPVKDFAIGVFGFNDKTALVIGTVVVSAALGALLGLAAARRFWIGVTGFAVFGALGGLAGARDPQLSATHAALSAALSVSVGVLVLAMLLRSLHTLGPSTADPGDLERPRERRAFLRAAGAFAVLAAIAAAGGRTLIERAKVVASRREEVVLPEPRRPAPDAPPAASLSVPELDPIVTPNYLFFRIDTVLGAPPVNLDTWRLRVTGMVDRPYELTFEQLLSLPMVEPHVTLSCVSNQVGGTLVGNAKWLGTPLEDVLNRAGVQSGATQIVGRSVDGFTVGFPTELAFDGRDALVAVGMNGRPLPYDHGFPARLVVPGLYGYVSATKWLAEIELTTLEGFDAYWIPRGWSKQAPAKTQSRIDIPVGSTVPAGAQWLAGFAWAPHRGISRVQVQIDQGPWVECTLSEEFSPDAWRQWAYQWDARPGRHTVRVRATDGTGAVQTELRRLPQPDGATGYHTRTIQVS